MTYQEIIQKNIKEFNDGFWKHRVPKNTQQSKDIKQWHTQSLLSFLEEENRRNKETIEKCKKLKGSKYLSETPEYFDGKIAILNDQIAHTIEIINYLKEM